MSRQFELKDSGGRQEFDTGARRDLQTGKGRPDLISTIFKTRLALVMERGAEKYGDRNWELGMPLSRLAASAMRHLDQAFEGQTDEDHLGQAAFNIMGWMHTKELIDRGILPKRLDDIPHWAQCGAAQTEYEYHVIEHGAPWRAKANEPNGTDWQHAATRILVKEAEDNGLIVGLDGIARPPAVKDESVKNPGEIQTPICETGEWA